MTLRNTLRGDKVLAKSVCDELVLTFTIECEFYISTFFGAFLIRNQNGSTGSMSAPENGEMAPSALEPADQVEVQRIAFGQAQRRG